MSLAFVVDRKTLIDELAIVIRSVEGKHAMPILAHVPGTRQTDCQRSDYRVRRFH
jgi:hypothetical protein